jgi:hypothetical protein
MVCSGCGPVSMASSKQQAASSKQPAASRNNGSWIARSSKSSVVN